MPGSGAKEQGVRRGLNPGQGFSEAQSELGRREALEKVWALGKMVSAKTGKKISWDFSVCCALELLACGLQSPVVASESCF